MLKRCVRCILPESYPEITFNEQGLCNYCLTHKSPWCRGQAALLDAVAPYRDNNDGKYDCLVGISGGRDSAFAAHYAAKVLNLRVLTYTYDNGFMPEQTKENVRNIVDTLGVDHVIDKNELKNVRHVLSSWMRKPSPAMIAFLCAGCQTGFKRGLAKTAQDNGIRLVISGGGEPEHSFAQSLLSISANGKRKRRLSLILGFLREIARNPCYHPNCLIAFAQEFFYRFSHKNKDLRWIRLFTYIGWDERTIHSVIEKELKWKNPPHSRSSWRSDCKIHLLRQYLYLETLGFTKNDDIMSSMIRENMVTREEGLKRLENENIISQEFLAEFLDELGLDFSDLNVALREYKKAARM